MHIRYVNRRPYSTEQALADSWDLVAHPVMQVIGEQALVEFWICLRLPGPAGVFLHPAVGWD